MNNFSNIFFSLQKNDSMLKMDVSPDKTLVNKSDSLENIHYIDNEVHFYIFQLLNSIRILNTLFILHFSQSETDMNDKSMENTQVKVV